MKEHNTPSVVPEEFTLTDEDAQQLYSNRRKRNNISVTLSIIVIMIILCACSYYCLWQHTQHAISTTQAMQQQLNLLRQGLQRDRYMLEGLLQNQSKRLDTTYQEQATLSRQFNELQEKISGLSGSHVKSWLLVQVSMLVKMASHKLWVDQDVTSATILLKSAETSLADIKDPSLIEVRRTILKDIDTLSSLTLIDLDSVTFRVNELFNQVNNLRLAEHSIYKLPIHQHHDELPGSAGELKQNLRKSWRSFIANFITIQRCDTSAKPQLVLSQDIYLRENIRSRLLIVTQAIPHHQNKIYKQSLDIISTWVRCYFNISDPVTKTFLEALDTLSHQSISINLPEQLKSPLLLKTTIRDTVVQPTC